VNKNEEYTVADAQQLNVVAHKLNEACRELIKLPPKDLSGREMESVVLHLESIVVSLQVRGFQGGLQKWRVCDKCGKPTGSISTICDECFEKE